MTYTMFDQVFWTAISGQVNKFRKKVMGIESTNFDKLEQHKGKSHGSVTKISTNRTCSSILVQLLA